MCGNVVSGDIHAAVSGVTHAVTRSQVSCSIMYGKLSGRSGCARGVNQTKARRDASWRCRSYQEPELGDSSCGVFIFLDITVRHSPTT